MRDVLIARGQRWRSKDPRDNGLLVTVLSYGGEAGFVEIQRYRKSRVRTVNFRKMYERTEGGAK